MPNGTSHWQVGNTTEQNGYLKMYLTHAKRDQEDSLQFSALSHWKDRVVGIACLACMSQSFANKVRKSKILAWGWGPLNYHALFHPEIQMMTQNHGGIQTTETNQRRMRPAELNLTEGISKPWPTKIVEYIKREDAKEGSNCERKFKERREASQVALNQHKRIHYCGSAFAFGSTSLGPNLLSHIPGRSLPVSLLATGQELLIFSHGDEDFILTILQWENENRCSLAAKGFLAALFLY